MLADGARVGADGKLYIFGGQWDRIFAPTLPTAQKLAFALVVRVEYTEAMKSHQVALVLVDSDGKEVGIRIAGHLTSGHPPGIAEGDPVSLPLAIEPPLIPINAYGRYEWKILLDSDPAGRMPMHVIPPPNVQLASSETPPTT